MCTMHQCNYRSKNDPHKRLDCLFRELLQHKCRGILASLTFGGSFPLCSVYIFQDTVINIDTRPSLICFGIKKVINGIIQSHTCTPPLQKAAWIDWISLFIKLVDTWYWDAFIILSVLLNLAKRLAQPCQVNLYKPPKQLSALLFSWNFLQLHRFSLLRYTNI